MHDVRSPECLWKDHEECEGSVDCAECGDVRPCACRCQHEAAKKRAAEQTV